MNDWTCSNCGGGAVQVSLAHPSLDDRFVVGYCERCTPEPVWDPKTQRTKPLVRATVALVNDPTTAHAIIEARVQRRREKRVIDKPKNEAEHQQRAAILARYDDEAAARRGLAG